LILGPSANSDTKLSCTAPEVISACGDYNGQKADIWSCGVMLYVMLYCAYPFERDEDEADKYGFQKVLERILRVDYHFPREPKVRGMSSA
jgi:serine/threonine-protein kinase SRK2